MAPTNKNPKCIFKRQAPHNSSLRPNKVTKTQNGSHSTSQVSWTEPSRLAGAAATQREKDFSALFKKFGKYQAMNYKKMEMDEGRRFREAQKGQPAHIAMINGKNYFVGTSTSPEPQEVSTSTNMDGVQAATDDAELESLLTSMMVLDVSLAGSFNSQ